MVPAQNRPAGSHLPSFMRIPDGSARSSVSGVTVPSSSSEANPVPAARTQPPAVRGTAAPSGRPTSWERGSVRSVPSNPASHSRPAMMSTQPNRPSYQNGPAACSTRTGEQGAAVSGSMPPILPGRPAGSEVEVVAHAARADRAGVVVVPAEVVVLLQQDGAVAVDARDVRDVDVRPGVPLRDGADLGGEVDLDAGGRRGVVPVDRVAPVLATVGVGEVDAAPQPDPPGRERH